MKVKIAKSKVAKVEKKKYIKISIGLIIKNSAKTLRKCLESLQPIRDAFPSELIIADTGSTDSSIEIAREFTSDVLHYEWDSDFSAARNSTVDRATGEWYMYIDSDEWLDNCDDIIRFIKSKDADKSMIATYFVRNYSDLNGSTYFDTAPMRIFRLDDEKKMRFSGKIHECIPYVPPIYQIKSFAHHYGYADFESPGSKQAKHERNLPPLLEEYKLDPKSPRTLTHLYKQYLFIDDNVNAEKILLEWLEAVRESLTPVYVSSCFSAAIKFYNYMKKYDKIEPLAMEYFELQKEVFACHLEIHALLGENYMKLERYDDAADQVKQYFILYKDFTAGKINTLDMSYSDIFYTQESYYIQTIRNYFALCALSKKWDEIIDFVDTMDLSHMELDKTSLNVNGDTSHTILILNHAFMAVQETQKYEVIFPWYKKFKKHGNIKKQKAFTNNMNRLLSSKFFSREPIYRDFAENEIDYPIDDYTRLMRLKHFSSLNNKEKAYEILEYFICQKENWDITYHEIISIALQMQFSILGLVERLDIEEASGYASLMNKNTENLPQYIVDTYAKHSNVKLAYWYACMCEAVLLRDEMPENSGAVLEVYLDNMDVYSNAVFAQKTDDNIHLFPRVHRFAYYMNKARKDGFVNNTQYVKLAVESYGVLKGAVDGYIEMLESDNTSAADEFASYATMVKIKLAQLIRQGRIQESKDIILMLEKLVPNDKEIQKFKADCEKA